MRQSLWYRGNSHPYSPITRPPKPSDMRPYRIFDNFTALQEMSSCKYAYCRVLPMPFGAKWATAKGTFRSRIVRTLSSGSGTMHILSTRVSASAVLLPAMQVLPHTSRGKQQESGNIRSPKLM